jgi:hypothetical protein
LLEKLENYTTAKESGLKKHIDVVMKDNKEKEEKEKAKKKNQPHKFRLTIFQNKNTTKKPTENVNKKAVKKEELDSLGEIFIKFTPFLKIYSQYINNYSISTEYLTKYRKENSAFDKYIKECIKNGRVLVSYLITPVQRIPRVKIIIKKSIHCY